MRFPGNTPSADTYTGEIYENVASYDDAAVIEVRQRFESETQGRSLDSLHPDTVNLPENNYSGETPYDEELYPDYPDDTPAENL